MILIVGLGNPGEGYKNNRHNVGHMLADRLKSQRRGRLFMSKLKSIMVFKTNTYMNDSGSFVKKLVDQYRVSLPNLWVIHDDLDISLGSYKIQKGRGPKVHNGLTSIYESLRSKDFWHVRIGVDARNPNNRILGEEYVLQDFTSEERKILDHVIDQVCKKLATI